MALSDQTLSALQQLMAQNNELVAQVQTTDDPAQVSALIADAAAKSGMDVTASELAAYFEEAAKTLTTQALSDQQLEVVAGGVPNDGLSDDTRMILISIFSLGTGCATVSLIQGVFHDNSGFVNKRYC
nr:hypothetical protein [uncultured Rhodoferax sp.]